MHHDVGHSHLISNKMSCDLVSSHAISVPYLVAVQAIYNFALRPQGIRSSVEFRHTLFTSKLGAAKYDEWAGLANKLQWALLLDTLNVSTDCPSKVGEKQFSVVRKWHKSIQVVNFSLSHVHVVSFCNLIDTTRAWCRKLTKFSADVTRLFPFWGREPGNKVSFGYLRVNWSAC